MTNNKANIRTLDLFCGAGGSSFGARNAGAKIVAGIDIWEPAIKVYQNNFPESKAILSDIRLLSPEELKNSINEIDLLLASPECTNHSKAKGSAPISEESRNSAFEVIRYAKVFKPTWLVVENVVEISTWSRFRELVSQIKDLGYFIKDDLILDSKDFGVPQARKRLFIVGSLLEEPEIPEPPNNAVKDIASFLEDFNKYTTSNLYRKGRARSTIKKAEKAIEVIGKGQPFVIVYYGSAKNGSGGWQRLTEPLRTITTLDRFAFVSPCGDGYQMRMLQPEELKHAMGYDSNFMIDNIENITRRDRIKLMGNGVCPPVMEVVVKALIGQK